MDLGELPEWSAALQAETFDCSPLKQPLAQVRGRRRKGAEGAGTGRRQTRADAGSQGPAPNSRQFPPAGHAQGRQHAARDRAGRLEACGATGGGGGRWVAAARGPALLFIAPLLHSSASLHNATPMFYAGALKPVMPAAVPAAAPAPAAQPAACSQADAGGAPAAIAGRFSRASCWPQSPFAAATTPLHHPLPAENDVSGAAAAMEAPRSVRRTHTPSRTGLTARAVRMPSRLGATPGVKAPLQFEVPLSARAAVADAAPATGKNLKSILKRLNFSATKARAAAAAHGGDEVPSTAAAAAPPTTAAGPAAQSTIKQLRFDVGATPAAPTAAKPGGRHVSFDATTVSPAPRGSRLGRSSGAPASVLRTPEPPIQEEASSGSSEDADAGAGSVNSAAAGHTPYDRRLSSLFCKYQVAGTPELADADLDDLVADGERAARVLGRPVGWFDRQVTMHCGTYVRPCAPCPPNNSSFLSVAASLPPPLPAWPRPSCRRGALTLLEAPLLRLGARVNQGAGQEVHLGRGAQPAGPQHQPCPCCGNRCC